MKRNTTPKFLFIFSLTTVLSGCFSHEEIIFGVNIESELLQDDSLCSLVYVTNNTNVRKRQYTTGDTKDHGYVRDAEIGVTLNYKVYHSDLYDEIPDSNGVTSTFKPILHNSGSPDVPLLKKGQTGEFLVEYDLNRIDELPGLERTYYTGDFIVKKLNQKKTNSYASADLTLHIDLEKGEGRCGRIYFYTYYDPIDGENERTPIVDVISSSVDVSQLVSQNVLSDRELRIKTSKELRSIHNALREIGSQTQGDLISGLSLLDLGTDAVSSLSRGEEIKLSEKTIQSATQKLLAGRGLSQRTLSVLSREIGTHAYRSQLVVRDK